MLRIQHDAHLQNKAGSNAAREKRQKETTKTRRINTHIGLSLTNSFRSPYSSTASAGNEASGGAQWGRLRKLHGNNMLVYSLKGREFMQYKGQLHRSLSMREDADVVKDCMGNYFIPNSSKFRKVWDLIVSLLIIYSCVVIPFRISFGEPNSTGWLVESFCIDTLFAIDLILNFFSFDTDKWGHRTKSFRQNAWYYFRTWFFIDFFSTVPIDLLITTIGNLDGEAFRTFKLVRILRLTRLLKLVRLLKLKKTTGRFFTQSHTLQHVVWRIIKLLLGVIFAAHLLTCFWHFVATLTSEDYEKTWLRTLTFHDPGDPTKLIHSADTLTVGDLYVSSFYWVIATMMAVGYGDVHATTSWERLYSIVTMLVGAAFFGVMIANISSLLDTLNARSNAFSRKMEEVKAYMKDRRLPKDLQARIRGYYHYYFSQKSLFNEEEVLRGLSTSLRNEIVGHTSARVIKRLHFFDNQDPSLVTALLTRMKPLFRITGEVLAVEGDIGKEMFFLVHGVVEMLAYIPDPSGVTPVLPSLMTLASLAKSNNKPVGEAMQNTGVPHGSEVVGVLKDGDHFGDPELVLHRRRPCGFRAAAVCDLQTLSKQDLEFVLYDFPYVRDAMIFSASERLEALEAAKTSQFIALTLKKLDPRVGDGDLDKAVAPKPGQGAKITRRKSVRRTDSTTAKVMQAYSAAETRGKKNAARRRSSVIQQVAKRRQSSIAPVLGTIQNSEQGEGSKGEGGDEQGQVIDLTDTTVGGNAGSETEEGSGGGVKRAWEEGGTKPGLSKAPSEAWTKLKVGIGQGTGKSESASSRNHGPALQKMVRDVGLSEGRLTYFDAAACTFAAAEVAMTLAGWAMAQELMGSDPKWEHGLGPETDEHTEEGQAVVLSSPLMAMAAAENKALYASSGALSPNELKREIHEAVGDSVSHRNMKRMSMSMLSEERGSRDSRRTVNASHDGKDVVASGSVEGEEGGAGQPKTGGIEVMDSKSGERPVNVMTRSDSSLGEEFNPLFNISGIQPLNRTWVYPLGKRAVELGKACRRVIAERKEPSSRPRYGFTIADALRHIRTSSYRSRLLMGPAVLYEQRLCLQSELPSGILNQHEVVGEQVLRTLRQVNGQEMEGVETERQLRRRRIFHPTDRIVRRWDLFMSIIILYSLIQVPFVLAFLPDPTTPTTVMETVIDVLFFLDMIFRFRIAYHDRERDVWETRPKKIAKHYLKSEFILDLLSTFPFDKIALVATSQTSDALRSFKLIRTVRLVRLLKLIRMARVRQFLNSASQHMLSIPPAVMQLITLCLQVTFIAHLLGCFFYFVASTIENSTTWSDFLDDDSLTTAYIASLYWGFTTMTTVGYGDLTAKTTAEKGFAIGAMMVGATVFGYIVGSVAGIVMKLNASAVKYDQKMEEISEYLRDMRVPKKLQEKVVAYYEYYLARRSAFDEDMILADLSDSIRREVILHLNRDIIQKIPYFLHEDREFVSHIVSLLKPQFYHTDNYLYHENEVAWEMFFLIKGKVEIVANAETEKEVKYATLEAGSYFGELSLLLGIRRSSSARALVPCNVFVLSRDDIQTTVSTYPALAARMEQSLRESLVKASQMKMEEDRKRGEVEDDTEEEVAEGPEFVANKFVKLWKRQNGVMGRIAKQRSRGKKSGSSDEMGDSLPAQVNRMPATETEMESTLMNMMGTSKTVDGGGARGDMLTPTPSERNTKNEQGRRLLALSDEEDGDGVEVVEEGRRGDEGEEEVQGSRRGVGELRRDGSGDLEERSRGYTTASETEMAYEVGDADPFTIDGGAIFRAQMDAKAEAQQDAEVWGLGLLLTSDPPSFSPHQGADASGSFVFPPPSSTSPTSLDSPSPSPTGSSSSAAARGVTAFRSLLNAVEGLTLSWKQLGGGEGCASGKARGGLRRMKEVRRQMRDLAFSTTKFLRLSPGVASPISSSSPESPSSSVALAPPDSLLRRGGKAVSEAWKVIKVFESFSPSSLPSSSTSFTSEDAAAGLSSRTEALVIAEIHRDAASAEFLSSWLFSTASAIAGREGMEKEEDEKESGARRRRRRGRDREDPTSRGFWSIVVLLSHRDAAKAELGKWEKKDKIFSSSSKAEDWLNLVLDAGARCLATVLLLSSLSSSFQSWSSHLRSWIQQVQELRIALETSIASEARVGSSLEDVSRALSSSPFSPGGGRERGRGAGGRRGWGGNYSATRTGEWSTGGEDSRGGEGSGKETKGRVSPPSTLKGEKRGEKDLALLQSSTMGRRPGNRERQTASSPPLEEKSLKRNFTDSSLLFPPSPQRSFKAEDGVTNVHFELLNPGFVKSALIGSSTMEKREEEEEEEAGRSTPRRRAVDSDNDSRERYEWERPRERERERERERNREGVQEADHRLRYSPSNWRLRPQLSPTHSTSMMLSRPQDEEGALKEVWRRTGLILSGALVPGAEGIASSSNLPLFHREEAEGLNPNSLLLRLADLRDHLLQVARVSRLHCATSTSSLISLSEAQIRRLRILGALPFDDDEK